MAIDAVRVKINDEWTDLEYNPISGKYEAQIVAPDQMSLILESGYYPIVVEAVNEQGVKIYKDDKDIIWGGHLRLMVNPQFVYDRTQKDVDRVKTLNEKYKKRSITQEEKEEWKNDMKGSLNESDLNRIEKNSDSIAKLFGITVDTKEWSHVSIPQISDYQRIRDNVQKIREAFFTRRDTPLTPLQPLNTYQKWNNIEKILHDAYFFYVNLLNSYNYCDTEIYAGEGVGDL